MQAFFVLQNSLQSFAKPWKWLCSAVFGFFKNHFAMLKQYFCNDIATLYPSPLKSLPKHKKAAIFSRFSHFNKSSKIHRFPAILCISTPKKRLCSAIFREIKLFKASEPLFSHSTWLITAGGMAQADTPNAFTKLQPTGVLCSNAVCHEDFCRLVQQDWALGRSSDFHFS